jgi:hypothetical protein
MSTLRTEANNRLLNLLLKHLIFFRGALPSDTHPSCDYLFSCLSGGRGVQHGVADELGDAVGVVGGLEPAVQEAAAFTLPALAGLAYFYRNK